MSGALSLTGGVVALPTGADAEAIEARSSAAEAAGWPVEPGSGAELPAAWLAAVEAHTEAHRRKRASRHRIEAMRADVAGKPATTVAWHVARASGQMRRFEKVSACGTEYTLSRTCGECGTVNTRPLGCSITKVCPSCRGKAARRMRKQVKRALGAVERSHRFLARRRRDPWAWRFVTVTVPHELGIGADLRDAGRKLLPRFTRWLRTHIEKDRGEATGHRPVYVRAIETTSEDESYGGHAHVHMLVFSPYLDHVMLRLWWGRALAASGRAVPIVTPAAIFDGSAPAMREPPPAWRRRQLERWLVTRRGAAGRELTSVPWPVVDVRKADDDPSRELVKYLVKDVNAGHRIRPKHFAQLYCALDGIRVVSASKIRVNGELRGLWAYADALRGELPCRCEDCESQTTFKYDVERHVAPKRGPPDPLQKQKHPAMLDGASA